MVPPTDPGPPPPLTAGRVLTRSAALGCAAGALELVSAWILRSPGSRLLELAQAVPPVTAVAFGVHLLAAAPLVPLVSGRPALREGLLRALPVALLAAQLHLVVSRAAGLAPGRTWLLLGALTGAVVGALSLPLLGRRTAHRWPAAARLAWPGLALCLAPALSMRTGSSGRERAVSGGHRIPRVLLIVVDTLRRDALGCYDEEAPPTPALDGLAAASLRFDRARSAGPWTLPSMCSILTGVSPLVHGSIHRSSRLPSRVPTLAERLAGAGYRTAAMGHNFVLSNRGLERGFDEFRLGSRARLPSRSLGFVLLGRLREDPAKELDAAALTGSALAWIEAHAAEDFFLWLHYYDPHLEYAPPPDLMAGETAPANLVVGGPPPPALRHRVGIDALEGIRGGYLVPTPEGRRWIRRLYDKEVEGLDRELARLFADLRSRGLFDDTLIVLTSDHGEEFWEHDGFEHGHTVYDELLSVPLLVKLPAGLGEAGVVEEAVSLDGLAPTVLTLCGLAPDPEAFSAPSWLDEAGNPVPPDPVVAALGNLYFQDRLALVFEQRKYVRDLLTGAEELYDLAGDPAETRSLVEREPETLAEARRRVEELLEAADRLRTRLGVTGPSEEALSEEELQGLKDIGYAR